MGRKFVLKKTVLAGVAGEEEQVHIAERIRFTGETVSGLA